MNEPDYNDADLFLVGFWMIINIDEYSQESTQYGQQWGFIIYPFSKDEASRHRVQLTALCRALCSMEAYLVPRLLIDIRLCMKMQSCHRPCIMYDSSA